MGNDKFFLEDLLVQLTKNSQVQMIFDPTFFAVTTVRENQTISLNEMAYMATVAFVYVNSALKKELLDVEQILETAHGFYKRFQDSDYSILKSFENMSIDEFNKVIQEYNGRDKKEGGGDNGEGKRRFDEETDPGDESDYDN